ncbi:MAG: DNA topoisomerase IB [Rhodanobacteraceae bacterium]
MRADSSAPPSGDEARELAAAAGLVYVSDQAPGLSRRRASRSGFIYLDADRARIRDRAVIERINKLAIPPAYERVWICANPRGHLQATGRDARGRKQYRYHPKWRATRDDDKFARIVKFGERLPHLRRVLRRDLAQPGLPESKVLAVMVSVLAETGIRVGNEEYAKSNGSYGLTTLRARHVTFLREGRAVLRFRGKSGQDHEALIDNARLVRLLRRVQQLPGQMLFQYIDDAGERKAVDSGLVNDYLRDAMGEEFTAKDFRTWAGTVGAIAELSRTELPEQASERALAASIAGVVKEVAARLRNTPAVCRNSYIDPAVFDAWRSGKLHRLVPPGMAHAPRKLEAIALKLLRKKVARARSWR